MHRSSFRFEGSRTPRVRRPHGPSSAASGPADAPRIACVALVCWAAIVMAGAGLADSHASSSDEAAAAQIGYRQKVMGAVGANMGAIGDILKNRLEVPGAIAIHAGQMADSAPLIGPAFKQRITAGPTDAKADIWQDWAKFEEAIADFEQAARGLQQAAAGPDPAAIGPAMKALGKSCSGCHKPFRKPKEESYKNE